MLHRLCPHVIVGRKSWRLWPVTLASCVEKMDESDKASAIGALAGAKRALRASIT